MKRIIWLSVIGLVYFLTIIVMKNYYQKKINLLSQELKNSQEKLKNKKNCPQIDLNDIFLMVQKNKILSQKKQGKMYFTANTSKISNNEWLININIEGEKNTLPDAVDFQLDFDQSIQIVEINTGNAFPIYPRKIIDDKMLLITGAISINDNSLILGKKDGLFATIKVKAESPQSKIINLYVNKNVTKIFSNGENILDDSKNLSQIKLRL